MSPTLPDTPALVVVDAQVGVMRSVWESARVIENLSLLVHKARTAGAPVIWVQHADEDLLAYGSAGWQLLPDLSPTATETVIDKRYNSSFAETDLGSRLKSLGVTRIVLAGGHTNWCIRSTAYAALELGYHLTLVADAHSTEALQLPDGTVVHAEPIVAELNAVIEWVSVPHVRTAVLSTADVVF